MLIIKTKEEKEKEKKLIELNKKQVEKKRRKMENYLATIKNLCNFIRRKFENFNK